MKNTKSLSAFSRFVWAFTGLLVLLILPLYAYKVLQKTDYTDFQVYYRAALRAHSADWSHLYTLDDGQSPFRYMPPFIGFFGPLAWFKKEAAPLFWYLIQIFSFGLGYFFLYLSLKRVTFPGGKNKPSFSPSVVCCLSLLFVLRLCLDTLTIGQVSSLMFLGFTIGLWGYVSRNPFLGALGISFPALLKIGPLVAFGTFFSQGRFKFKKAVLGLVFAASGFLAFGEIWGYLKLGSWNAYHSLWNSWAQIVGADSQYYDSSHYGSQSINSALLRAAKSGWITATTAHEVYLWTGGVTVLFCVFFWILRSPKSSLGRGLFFSLGLFPYFWVMPETFKYSLTPLSIAFAFLWLSLLAPRFRTTKLSIWTRFTTAFALCFGFLTITIAGKDVIGDRLFFGSQEASFPLLATCFLGVATALQAFSYSQPSKLASILSKVFHWPHFFLGPWQRMPNPERPLSLSVLIPFPLSGSGVLDAQFIENHLLELLTTLKGNQKEDTFEILFIPYGNDLLPFTRQFHPVLNLLNQDKRFKQIQILLNPEINGRGCALREGFLSSLGKKFLVVQLEQICSPSFFVEALKSLDQGYDLIRANRRLKESSFELPVKILPWVYQRHRLGMRFNEMVRSLFPIQTSDTHSGNYGVSWKLAVHAFSSQITSHFLFDLELSLVARSRNYRELDLPVNVKLEIEKSNPRVWFELLTIFHGLPVLWMRFRKGCYGEFSDHPSNGKSWTITADDWGLSAGVNAGILTLAQQGIVNRVSVMANGDHLQEKLSVLLKIKSQIEIGLHFNLTYGRPLSPKPFKPLLEKNGDFIRSPFRFLLRWMKIRVFFPAQYQSAKAFIGEELKAQLDRLQQLGVPIQYLDGHHHIHMVPGLLDVLARNLNGAHWVNQVRLPFDKSLLMTSQAPVSVLAWLNRSKMKTLGFKYLPFAYPQAKHFLDPGLLRAYLKNHSHKEVIVHPALVNDLTGLRFPDSYQDGRVTEFRSLRMLGVKT